MNIKQYFDYIKKNVEKEYEIANRARSCGFDPESHVEVPIALSLAEKAVGLVSTLYPQLMADRKIVDRVLNLEKEYGSLDPAVALSIAEEIAKEKFCKFESHKEAFEAGVRVASAYLTLGVVSSPIEGFVKVDICKTLSGEDYIAPYYAGPIRSAGGTEAAFSLVIIDHLREIFGYSKYDPTEEEIKRGVHETYMYHERVTNLQYLPTEAEVEFLMKNLSVQVSGDPSDDREVYNYKDLPRVPTNFIRSGFCLTLNEGLAQKAPKIWKRIQRLRERGFKLTDWSWLGEFVEFQEGIKSGKKKAGGGGAVYIKDLVAGRPVFGHPSRSGSLRIRYGRSRNTGYSALAMNPASMFLSNNFIAVGTQLRIEKPTKGCTVASCTTIDGPIVKFKDGSVKKIHSIEESKKIYKDVSEIIYFGDILVPYGDYMNRNHHLDRPAYVEQYWLEHVLSKGGKSELHVSFEDAKEFSKKYGVPLHPDYIFYWREIDLASLFDLLKWLKNGSFIEDKFVLSFYSSEREVLGNAKRALELIGCPHEVSTENVLIEKVLANALLFNLGCVSEFEKPLEFIEGKLNSEGEKVLDIINHLCEFEIKDKSGTFVGSRMGRPEKAKLRKLTGSPHVLFPVGNEGGRLRSFQSAYDVGFVKGEFPNFYCDNCGERSFYSKCVDCGESCKKLDYCYSCGSFYKDGCPEHDRCVNYSEQKIDIRKLFDHAKKIAGVSYDQIPIVKGVRGTSNADHSTEFLAKGLLRAKYNLNVNKDGSIRYDISEMPITHFKPKEVGVRVEKLKELGYELDYLGKKLENEDQILEIFPHDVILPACPDSPDEKADDVFLKVSQFVDDEFERIYGLEKYFNAKTSEDIVGSLLGCMAPHNCAAVVGRIIGFSKVQALLASPYMHAAMRRDCDGDEAAVMLLMDVLLNFSKHFLPAHRGGTQDAPLVLNARMKAGEVDDMIFDVDVGRKIPLELFEAAEEEKSPYEIKMEQVKGRLGGNEEFNNLFFSYDTEDINLGPLCSDYKLIPTMTEKVEAQMDLCSKIRAVDVSDVSRLIIERHFIRDTRGNLRKFSMQGFRCVGCNEKYRRPPLSGKCENCGGKIIFTISEGSIIKYMEPALNLARKYGVSAYLLESLELTEMYIQSIFGKEKEKQEVLAEWF